LEDNVVSASRVTPKELEEMLDELFEGWTSAPNHTSYQKFI
jgi:hypothetical protein